MSVAPDFDLFGNPSFARIKCCNCQIVFGMLQSHQAIRLDDHKAFWCPNGHEQYYIGEREVDKLRKILETERANAKWFQARRDELEKKNRAARSMITRVSNEKSRLEERIKNGVCPCCKRSFQNLKRHMASKHSGKKK